MANLCVEADVRKLVGLSVSAAVLAKIQDGQAFLIGDATEFGLIPERSTEFEDMVNRTFSATTETIKVDGQATNRIVVPVKYTPIISIASLVYPLSESLSPTDYVFDGDAGIIELVNVNTDGTYVSQESMSRFAFPRFPKGRANITITLTHGWATTPADVRGAVARAVAADVLGVDAGSRDAGLRSKQLGDRSETYGDARHKTAQDAFLKAFYDTAGRYTLGRAG